MNYYEHHIGDYAEATSHLSILEDGVYSRLLRKYYASEKPLPADVKEVQRLIGCRTTADRKAVTRVLHEFFKSQSDGWHNVRCDEEIEYYLEAEPERQAKRDNEKERKRRSREYRKDLFNQLRELGLTPKWDTSISDLEAHLSRLRSRGTVTDRSQNGHAPGTRDSVTGDAPSTASQAPLPSPQSPSEDLTPKPPLEKGASRHRRSLDRAERDKALEVFNQLVASGGAQPPRDSKLQAAIDAVGGWSRIQQRSDRDEQSVRNAFCDAYRSAAA